MADLWMRVMTSVTVSLWNVQEVLSPWDWMHLRKHPQLFFLQWCLSGSSDYVLCSWAAVSLLFRWIGFQGLYLCHWVLCSQVLMDFAGWEIRRRLSVVGDREWKERIVVTDVATGNLLKFLDGSFNGHIFVFLPLFSFNHDRVQLQLFIIISVQ